MDNKKWEKKFINGIWKYIHKDTGTKFDLDGYDIYGYDRKGFNKIGIHRDTKTKFDLNGYNKDGYDGYGYNRYGYNRYGYNGYGYDIYGYDRKGFNKTGIHRDTKTEFDLDGYNKDGYNREGYDRKGFNKTGIHRDTKTEFDLDGYDRDGYDIYGYHRNGYNIDGYDRNGYDRDGYDKDGYDRDGYDRDGYDKDGYDRDGYDRDGYDKDGYDRKGYNIDGYDRKGFNKTGIHRDTKTKFDIDGYDRKGYNIDGYDIDGLDKTGKTREERKEIQNTQKRNYLGLLDKAEKLGKGQMSIEEYIARSKTPIDELIQFAKKEHLSPDIIRGLYKQMKPYKVYAKPFEKKKYLESRIIIIDGKEIKPTEQDVDLCIKYLKINDILICAKNVETTVRKYLKGEIDISIDNSEAEYTVNKTELEQLEEEQKHLNRKIQEIKELESQITQAESKKKTISIGD